MDIVVRDDVWKISKSHGVTLVKGKPVLHKHKWLVRNGPTHYMTIDHE